MNNWGKMRLLTWKYFQFRKYYWIATLFEIIFPAILIYVTVKISELWIDTSVPKRNESIIMNTTEYLFVYDTLLYTPFNTKENNVMDFVRNEIRKVSNKDITIKGIASESAMVLEISTSNENISGIVFLEISDTMFRYKIRDKNIYDTDSMFFETESQQIGPPETDVYSDTGFLNLMATVNRYFLVQSIQKKNVDFFELQMGIMEPLPYPDYIVNVPSSRAILQMIMAYAIIIVSLVLCTTLLFIIISEKENRMMELMKVAGVQERLLWLSWFLNSLIIGLFVCTVITYLLKYTSTATNIAIISVVHTSVLWVCLILYYIAQIAFCFMFCALFGSIFLGAASLFITTMTVSYIALKCHQWQSTVFVHLSCFIPAGAFIQGFIRFTYYEMLGVPLHWESLFANEINTADASIGFVFVLLIFDLFFYLFLTYYFRVVNPSRRGFQKSPFFILKKGPLKRHQRQKPTSLVEDTKNPFMEPLSEDADVTIVLKDLEKSFGYVQAIKNVSLTLCKNEILVLLGHNRSGKTTTVSMITGLTEPTKGHILLRGRIDLLKNMDEFRKNIGVCPEVDSLFPYMSVIDHLLFFALLKGASNEEAVEEAREYLRLMDLESNEDDMISVVSSGMKRKLSLSMALMGKADVLILDEPTAGLDFLSKQKIWNLLTQLRKNRTIILTTTLMEDANAVGDRIAIINQGLIVACGSVQFLKKTFGIGYRLTILRKMETKTKNVTSQLIDMIKKSIPGCKLEDMSLTEIVFSLPSSETAKFPGLLRGLKTNSAAFNIERFIVSASTLEQLFVKLGGESVYNSEGKLLKYSSVIEEPVVIERIENKVTGLKLKLLQHRTLFVKRLIYLHRNGMTFLLRVVLPTVLMILLLRGTMKFEKIDPPLELTLQAVYPQGMVLIYDNNDTNLGLYQSHLTYIKQMDARPKILSGDNVYDAFLLYAHENINSYRREVIMATDFSKKLQYYKSFYNRWARHAKPILLVTMDNTLLNFFTEKDSVIIVPINHPVKSVDVSKVEDKYDTDISEQSPIITVWFILLAFFTIDLLDYFAILVKVERIDGFKHIQLLSSVSVSTYWINSFIFDFFLFFIIVIFRLLVFRPFDSYGFFIIKYHMLIILLMIVLFIASGLLFVYVVSFAANSKFGSYLFFFCFNIICSFISFGYYSYETTLFSGSTTSSLEKTVLTTIKYTILLIPPLNFSLAFEKFLMTWRVNNLVSAYAQHGLSEKYRLFRYQYVRYLEYASVKNPNGILEEILFMIVDIFLYAGLLYIIEQKTIIRFIYSKRYHAGDKDEDEDEDENMLASITNDFVPKDVQDEREKVDAVVETMKTDSPIKDALIVKGLRKIYDRLFRRPVIAVDDATFMVSAGQCFGVLGSSGSGKTTIFKMLAGEILPTHGNSWCLNINLLENKTEYFSNIGYCAETNCFLEELTGKETLDIIASLRGVTSDDREKAVIKWLSILGLEPVENKRCGEYSEGNKRKMCTGLALIGDPSVVLLDEPTSGIDPVSRRRLYNVLIQIKSTGQAIALTSHSIEECETLCDRLTILVKGNMRFIGTIEELKNKYGLGYSLLIKLQESILSDIDDVQETEIQRIKKLITGKFRRNMCILKEETQNLLRYQIKEKLPIADAFQRIEEVKRNEKMIIEYFLTEISLEEIFLSFTY